jgi:class 3 adenylate cyclase/YHS domain-containing protein
LRHIGGFNNDMEKDVAILMADLSGYTAMTDVHGGASAARIVNRYLDIVNQSLAGTSRLVQRIGDQVVVLADKAEDLLTTIKKLELSVMAEDHFLSIHAGLHFGPVLTEGENFFGSTINIASRIMNMAKRGQVLCSSSFVQAVGTKMIPCTELGKFKFKNVLKEVELFELVTPNPNTNVVVDPVCHMRVSEPTGYRSEFSGTVFHFCSKECRDIFESDKEGFAHQSHS